MPAAAAARSRAIPNEDACDALRRRGDRDVAVVFTSDHGELLGACLVDDAPRGITTGNHQCRQKGNVLYRENVSTPLVIVNGQRGGQEVVDGVASAVDVLPTLLDLAGAPRDPTLPGTSLLPRAWRPETPGRRAALFEAEQSRARNPSSARDSPRGLLHNILL